MSPLNPQEVEALYGCLLLGETFSLKDYYAVRKQYAGVALYDKGAIEWVNMGRERLRLTAEAKEFLETQSEERK